MSRLRALLAALPEILPIVEAIGDLDLRYRVFDTLTEAALADAAIESLPKGGYGKVLVADPSAPQGVSWRTPEEQAGTVYGNPVHREPTTGDTAAFNLQHVDTGASNENRLLLIPTDAASAEQPQPGAVYNAAADFDGTRHVGTYTMDSPATGTFTPTTGAERLAWMTEPALRDAVGLSAEGNAQVRLETGAGSEPLRPAVNPPSETPAWDEVNRQHQR